MRRIDGEAISFRRRLELELWGIPDWCHHHCGKMQYIPEKSKLGTTVFIKGSAAEVMITGNKYGSGGGVWYVEYIVKQSLETGRGRVFMDNQTLREAFGLSDKLRESGDS